jgi:hypothetical protein
MNNFMLGPAELVIILFIVTVILVPFWRICTKAGYPGALAVLMLVPLLNIVMLYFLAFAEWPVLRRTGR